MNIRLLILTMLIATPCLAAEYGPYDFTVSSVYDGDTIKGSASVWPGLSQFISIRVNGIDTPELRTKNKCEKRLGLVAKQALIDYIANKKVVISNVKLGKYAGRVLADISVDGEDVASYMIKNGYARRYDGGKRLGWCR